MARRYFVVGLLTLLPVFITLWVLWALFSVLDGIWSAIFRAIVGRHIPGLGLVLTLLLILITGVLATNVLGQRVIRMAESGLVRIPLANRIYSLVKEMLTSVLRSADSSAFVAPVIVEFPGEGAYSLGFVTGKDSAGFEPLAPNLLRVFVPTTPNITTGFLIMVPSEKCVFPNLTVEQALRVVLSAGVLAPSEIASRQSDSPSGQA